jgi:Domain of unknown function (DUF4249)
MKIVQSIFLLILLTFFSCDDDFFEQVVVLDLPEHTPGLAITANFSNVDTNLVVYVSSSVGVLEPDQPTIVENASVELFKDGQLLYNFEYNTNGLYGKVGIDSLGNNDAEYTLKIQAPGFDPVSSTQRMPQPVAILEASFEKDGAVTPEGGRVNNISITFNDPADIENYYSIRAWGRVVQNGNEYSNMVYLNSHNPIVEEGEQFLVFSDATFDGREVTLNFYTYDNYPENAESVELDINLTSITKDRYFFEKSLNILHNSNGNPFVEPVVVHNNIENGYGIFTMESCSYFTVKIL